MEPLLKRIKRRLRRLGHPLGAPADARAVRAGDGSRATESKPSRNDLDAPAVPHGARNAPDRADPHLAPPAPQPAPSRPKTADTARTRGAAPLQAAGIWGLAAPAPLPATSWLDSPVAAAPPLFGGADPLGALPGSANPSGAAPAWTQGVPVGMSCCDAQSPQGHLLDPALATPSLFGGDQAQPATPLSQALGGHAPFLGSDEAPVDAPGKFV